jgi:hypothetical protein
MPLGPALLCLQAPVVGNVWAAVPEAATSTTAAAASGELAKPQQLGEERLLPFANRQPLEHAPLSDWPGCLALL